MQVSAVGCCCLGRCLFRPDIALRGQGYTRGDSAGARSEQVVHSTPVLRSGEKDSNIRDRVEHGDQETGVRHPSETAPEGTSGGRQGERDADDVVQPGRSRGKSCRSAYIIVRIDYGY